MKDRGSAANLVCNYTESRRRFCSRNFLMRIVSSLGSLNKQLINKSFSVHVVQLETKC